MKMTLLDLTQNVLSSLSSDEVNSISDTTESMQVAQMVKTKYFDIITRVELPEHEQFIQLDASLDITIPVQMFIPANVAEVKWLKYFNSSSTANFVSPSHDIGFGVVSATNWSTTSTTSNTLGLGAKTFTVLSNTLPIIVGQTVTAANGTNIMTCTVTSYVGFTLVLDSVAMSGSGTFTSWIIQATGASSVPGYQYVTILPVQQFMDMVNKFDPGEVNVDSFTFTESVNNMPGTYTFYYKTDRQPCYCTVLSNYNVIFDSYDSTQDSTLQTSKSMAWARIIPTWEMVDSFIPNLDDNQFQLLLNEVKSLAYFELKQSIHSKAEQEAKRQWNIVQKDKSVDNKPSYFDALPNFGRVPSGNTRSRFTWR